MAALLRSLLSPGPLDVTTSYNARSAGPLAQRISLAALNKSYLSLGPLLVKFTSAITHVWKREWEHLNTTSFSATQSAVQTLHPDFSKALTAHAHGLSTDCSDEQDGRVILMDSLDTNNGEPDAEFTNVSYAESSSVANSSTDVPSFLQQAHQPLTASTFNCESRTFLSMLDKIKLLKDGGKTLYFLPIATRLVSVLGTEAHIVALVIIPPQQPEQTGRILLLDSKGAYPDTLYLPENPQALSATSQTTCADVIQYITQQPKFKNYSLEVMPNFQKTRDCTLCIFMMLSRLALQVSRGQEIDLTEVINTTYANYAQIDALRAHINSLRH